MDFDLAQLRTEYCAEFRAATKPTSFFFFFTFISHILNLILLHSPLRRAFKTFTLKEQAWLQMCHMWLSEEQGPVAGP